MPAHARRRGEPVPAEVARRNRDRRRQLLRSLPFLALLIAFIARVFVLGHSASGLVHAVLVIAVVLVFSIAQGYGVHLSAKRTWPRPRWHYFLAFVTYLAFATAGGVVGLRASADHVRWLSQLMIAVIAASGAGAFIMFGRGAFRGRIRRSFWRLPPPWLDQALPHGNIENPVPASEQSAPTPGRSSPG